MITECRVRSAQTVHLSCTDTNNLSEPTETRFAMTHVTLELHQVRPKTISESMIRSTQTVHLYCVKISTITKQFLGVHQVRPKQFLTLWYVCRKLCTYLAS
jgi:hypothetical protein